METQKDAEAIASHELLAVAVELHEAGHATAPFMTCNSGMRGCYVKMECHDLPQAQWLHAAMVKFFSANGKRRRATNL